MSKAWNTLPLGAIASVAVSGVNKHILPGETPVRLCNYLDVYRNRRLTKSHEFSAGSARPSEVERFQVRKGDVIITKDSETPDDIAVPALIVDDVAETVCGYHLALIRPSERLHPGFLSYLFQSETAKRYFLRTATGLTRFGLSVRAIESFPVPLPPTTDQAAIARVLDALDTALERTREAIARAQELRISLIAELLSRGVGTDGTVRNPKHSPTQFAKTPLGQLPAAWTLSRVGQQFTMQNGFTINEAQQTHLPKRRYLRVANVQRDALKLDDIQELKAGDEEYAPRVLQTDDLLVVEGHADRMQIGRCARVNPEAAGMTFQNHLFRLRTNGNLIAAFACLWLNSIYAFRYWNACCATSSGLNTINQRMLKRLVTPVPPKPEQERITAIVAQQQKHLQALVAKQKSLEQLKKSLMHDLLTGRVRIPKHVV